MKVNQQIDIQQFLPHREPMLFVDTISWIEKTYVEALFTIKPNQLFIQNDYFTEVGLLENMAQVCSTIIGQNYFINFSDVHKGDVIGFISSIKQAEIMQLPKVNQIITTKATLLEVFDYDEFTISLMQAQVMIAEETIATATMNLMLQNHKK
ncbi:hypothetical protein HX001_05170 [Empedobacter brevis]|uniref:Uncharacterized protein n=1 Tax=Empedobacter brevis TaxID=247 RepID=A0AAJ1V6S0_9FLAO|nr:hypothetical protein [Empedobacter brevis]MDM1071886.1 hypothetical protein [Empedobacter brevis]QES94237.1 hypothetical protein F0358_16700 [Empedobacter brevis]QHC86099.1 hypothetical protein AS589_15555 [Empedobacter brevis]